MAAQKFLSWKPDPLRPLNFKDKKRWATDDGKLYKLISPDYEKDIQYTEMSFSRTKAYSPDEKLWISGMANANIVDRVDERLDPRGLDVVDYMKNRQLLAHHSYHHPIGQVSELNVTEQGVEFLAWVGDPALADLTDMQKEIRSLVAQGILKTVSVGFIPKKIRAATFDDNGRLLEPTVIEAWELLELSIVAIPCNQDSIFEIRGYQNEKSHANLADISSTDNQSLNNTSSGSDSVAKKNTKEDAPPAGEDNKQDNVNEELLTLMRAMAEGMKKQLEVSEAILSKVDGKPMDEEDEEEEDKQGDEEEDEEEDDEEEEKRLTDLEKAVGGLAAKFDKLVDTVKLIADKVTKK